MISHTPGGVANVILIILIPIILILIISITNIIIGFIIGYIIIIIVSSQHKTRTNIANGLGKRSRDLKMDMFFFQ